MDKKLIAYCGINCETCEARIATINDDNELREKVAKLWSELNNVVITPEMINCEGCRMNGKKTVFCESLCEIRLCAISKQVSTCGDCKKASNCEYLKRNTGTDLEALASLHQKN